MNYFETIMTLRAPANDRYQVHAAMEDMIRKAFLGDSATTELRNMKELVPEYNYLLGSKDEATSIIAVRSFVPIGLPGERQKQLSLKPNQKLTLKFLMCTSVTPSSRSREDVMNDMAVNRLTKAGLNVEAFDVTASELYQIRKSKNNFFLPATYVTADVSVQDVATAETAIIGGISKKRCFGFGYVRVLE